MLNNFNFRLLITYRDGTVYQDLALMDKVTELNVASAPIEVSVVNGSFDRGIVQGIEAIKAGSKISFSAPIVPSDVAGAQDLTEFWKTILNNSRYFRYYIVRVQEGLTYRRELKPSDNMGYKSKFINNAGNATLNFIAVDNFYVGEEISIRVHEFEGGQGQFQFEYESITAVSTISRFLLVINNTVPEFFSFLFFKPGGTGITFSGTLPGMSELEFNGRNLILTTPLDTPKFLIVNGAPPTLDLGITDLRFTVNSPKGVDEFYLRYNPRVDF